MGPTDLDMAFDPVVVAGVVAGEVGGPRNLRLPGGNRRQIQALHGEVLAQVPWRSDPEADRARIGRPEEKVGRRVEAEQPPEHLFTSERGLQLVAPTVRRLDGHGQRELSPDRGQRRGPGCANTPSGCGPRGSPPVLRRRAAGAVGPHTGGYRSRGADTRRAHKRCTTNRCRIRRACPTSAAGTDWLGNCSSAPWTGTCSSPGRRGRSGGPPGGSRTRGVDANPSIRSAVARLPRRPSGDSRNVRPLMKAASNSLRVRPPSSARSRRSQ